MVEPANLGRIRVLEDIEAIKKLKSKYWRCVDNKLFDEAADCFTEDGIFDAVPFGANPRGRKAITLFFTENVGESIVSAHQGHNPEIEITSDTTANGRWALYTLIHNLQVDKAVIFWGSYEDEYVKEEGEWKIRNSRITIIPWQGRLIMQPTRKPKGDKK